MKELSIEEKAKRYDEALKVLHKYDGANIMFSQSLKEEMFPELKESEDERIKKGIIKILETFPSNTTLAKSVNKEECIAWLEKQGKNNIGISEATKQELEDNLNKALEKETPESWNEFLDGQCEQKPADKVEPKFKVGQTIKKEGFNLGFTIAKIEDGFYYNDEGDYFPFTDQDNWKLVEQKPAWSEEDEVKINRIASCLENLNVADNDILLKDVDWLKSLKDRVQPKQEWNEEDEKFVHGLIRGLAAKRDIHGHTTFSSDCIDITKTINWLKSLRPQNKWKPSDVQMEALDDFIYAKYPNIEKYGAAVKSLYQDLKKLREE